MIRAARRDDWKGIAKVHVDCMHTAYQGILPEETLNKFTYENREMRWEKDLPKTISGGTMNYIVEDNQGNIVGFALGGTMRDARLRIHYTGEVYGVYVHPSVQGQGLGKKLLESVAQHLITLHHSTMALWTFKDHDSCSFFEHLNGEQIYEKKTTIAAKKLLERAYGWEHLEDFTINTKGIN